MDRTLERAAACRAAGADGVSVPRTVGQETVKESVAGVGGPLAVVAFPGARSAERRVVGEPAVPGVARTVAGAGPAEAARSRCAGPRGSCWRGGTPPGPPAVRRRASVRRDRGPG
ncbi:hypothetical protein ACL07V_04010 [Streptomyces sp. MB22_4]|uniref:hypothetical protein n=1 Tax=Streptomyces sp. MB22_4 TaxID=3383120 RepID=UPI0039A2F0F7